MDDLQSIRTSPATSTANETLTYSVILSEVRGSEVLEPPTSLNQFATDSKSKLACEFPSLQLLQRSFVKLLCSTCPDLDEALVILDYLTPLSPTEFFTEAPKISKLLKSFVQQFSQSPQLTWQTLSRKARTLLLHWKSALVSNDLATLLTGPPLNHTHLQPKVHSQAIPYPGLRRSVCRKVAKTLESNGFTQGEARSLALEIELNLRKSDPRMANAYHRQFNAMMKDIKLLYYEPYQHAQRLIS